MSISIKVSYHKAVACFAQVDNDLGFLSEVYVSAGITRKFRHIAAHRPDIILAMMREDKEVKRHIHPFVSILGTQIPIAHLVICPRLCDVVRNLFSKTLVKGVGKTLIYQLRLSIGKISYVNGDRTDCRRSNLRMFSGDDQPNV